MKVLHVILFILLLPILPFHWLMCRFAAHKCPRCNSKWKTEQIDEWDGLEGWKCHCCGNNWEEFYV